MLGNMSFFSTSFPGGTERRSLNETVLMGCFGHRLSSLISFCASCLGLCGVEDDIAWFFLLGLLAAEENGEMKKASKVNDTQILGRLDDDDAIVWFLCEVVPQYASLFIVLIN